MGEENVQGKFGHWAEELGKRIAAEKKPPYIICSGITTSGPTHLGTLCEFLFPSAIYEYLKGQGKNAKFLFVADIMDAFDSVPSAMKQYEAELSPHLGKPLAKVPDPTGKTKNLGEFFLQDALLVMQKFDVKPEILRASELYAQGNYDRYAKLYFEKLDEVKKVVAESSMRELPKWWSPIMPICANCGRIATTQVAKFDSKTGDYEYVCDRDVKYTKGCGFSGKANVSQHEYKITWRLDWPTRQKFLGVSAEGAGVDHMTKGGSWDTAAVVHEKFLGNNAPVPYKYGFILFQGQKYSKSKGTGMGVTELLRLVPPEVIKYMLFRPDLQENIDIDPSGKKLLVLFEEFENAAKLELSDSLDRADRKKCIASQLALGKKKPKWKAGFTDILLYCQIYGGEEAGKQLGDEAGVKYLEPYIKEWVSRKFMPEEYDFTFAPQKTDDALVKKFANELKDEMGALAIHNLVFEIARGNGEKPEALFEKLYQALISKPKGPRLGKFIAAIGIGRVKKVLLD